MRIHNWGRSVAVNAPVLGHNQTVQVSNSRFTSRL